jgi:hypothetical protein
MKVRRRWLMLMVFAALASACYSRPMLVERAEAKRLASNLQAALSRTVEVTNRPSGQETSGFEAAAGSVMSLSGELRPVLEVLDYSDALAILDTFDARFREYRSLNAAIDADAQPAIRGHDDADGLVERLGKRRRAAAGCIDQLKALDEALARHKVTPTR